MEIQKLKNLQADDFEVVVNLSRLLPSQKKGTI